MESSSPHPPAIRKVAFEFAHSRAVMDDATLERVLTDPPLYEGGGLPYHLDRAHAKALAELPKGARVLEIGCGGGQCREWIESIGLKYFGTDISQTRIQEELRVHGGADFLSDVHFAPLKEESFDAVYCAAVFEHLACPHLACQNIRALLKPGGLFLGNVSFLEAWHDNSFFHMTPNGVIELLRSGGLDPEYVWPSRNYSGFKALPRFGLRGPFKLLWVLGYKLAWSYDCQEALRNVYKKWRGRPVERPIMSDATMAGAIDWIAKRPSGIDSP